MSASPFETLEVKRISGSLCVIIRRAPYGMIHAAEAIRLINGGVVYGLRTVAILMDDGVYVAKDNQDARPWVSLSDTLKLTLEFSTRLEDGTENRAEIYVHKGSMETRELSDEDLIKGTRVADDNELADLIAKTDAVITF